MERIVRLAHEDRTMWGILDGETVRKLDGSPFGGDIRPGEVVGSIGDTRLLAPTVPSKVICVGRNYAAHAAELKNEVPEQPLLFLKPPSSVVGPREPIVLPSLSDNVEHESELALVIGRRCRNLSEDDAWSAVFGVTCANDVTARDLQRSDKQWTRGKGFDTFCPVGPWVVTGHELTDIADLGVTCRVNGVERQSGRTSQMVFPPAFLLSYITAVMTLEPGDLVLTGTPAGVGPLIPGDVVDVEVEGVGTLSNPVVDGR
ncbi:MAG: fumarylacetoacetate hydrolase family protein [bacterium]|nr:fumarylacetoacetate hydrolase family protein [bacterium]